MHVLALLTLAANAQNRPDPSGPTSLADDPNHDAYVAAVSRLDLPLTIDTRANPQYLPGTWGYMRINGLNVARIAAIHHPNEDDLFVEAMIYYDVSHIAATEASTFSLVWGGNLVSNNYAGIDGKTASWNTNSSHAAYDAFGEVAGAKFVVSNNDVPSDWAAQNPDLDLLTPLTNNKIALTAFDLVQVVSGVPTVVGWLLRERRDYGGGDIVRVDQWYYRATCRGIASVADTVTVRPTLVLDDGVDNSWTQTEFLAAIKAQVGSPLVRRQVGAYTTAAF